MRLLFISTVCLLLAVSSLCAQTWSRDYEIGGHAAVAADGSIVLVGNRGDSFTPGRQLVVMRLDPSGAVTNLNVIGYDRDDRENQVVLLADGAIAIADRHRLEGGHDSPTDPNLAVIVLEPDLTLRWQRMLIVGSFDYSPKLMPTADGGVVLLGDADPDLDGNQDVWLTRFDANGQMVWQKMHGTGSAERPSDIAALPGGGFVVAGFFAEANENNDMFLARFDDAGDLQWARKYGVFDGTSSDRGFAVAAASDGSLYLAGESNAFGGVGADWLAIKLDGDGNVLWARRMDGALNAQSPGDRLRESLAVAGGVVLVGGRPADTSNYNPWAMRLDGDGNYVWSRAWPEGSSVEALEVHATPEGGFLFANQGTALGTGVGRLIRTNASGLLQSGCDPGNYNGILPQPATVSVAALDWQSSTTNIAPTAEPFFENDETYGILATCVGMPGEVSRLAAATPLGFAGADRLVWEDAAASGSTSFDLYRGDLADLKAGGSPDCLQSGLVVAEAFDSEQPAPDAGFGYLVGGRNANGLGTLGFHSDGSERPNALACP